MTTQESLEKELHEVYQEFDGYKYNKFGACLNPTILTEYDNDNIKYKLSYSKIDKGYVTGVEYLCDTHGIFSGCSIYSNNLFNNLDDAKIHCVDYLINCLLKEPNKSNVNNAVNTAKKFKFSILHKQLELF